MVLYLVDSEGTLKQQMLATLLRSHLMPLQGVSFLIFKEETLGHGFFTAGIMKGFGKINLGDMNVVGRTIIQAMVGGTVSRVTGGKFANGAITSAIQFVVNENPVGSKKDGTI